MLFEIIVQTFLGVLAIYFSVLLLRSRKYWKMIIGIALMAAGIVFTFTTGEILMALMGYLPESGTIKQFLLPLFPYAVAAAFVAWLAYVALAYFHRLRTFGILWEAFRSKRSRSDHLEAAKTNALRNQFVWLVISLGVTLMALLIISTAWSHQDILNKDMTVMIIGLVWVFVVPPLVIHTSLKKPDEILALKDMKSLANVKTEMMGDYRELIAVMDEIKDERLKRQLDGLIIDGLAVALIEHRASEEKSAQKK